jgi:membrane-bound lytic murein transglycosylase D
VGRSKLICVVSALFVLASCGTAGKRQAYVQPRAQAFGPAILPLTPIAPLARPPQKPAPDAVEQVIAEAEKAYDAGFEDYRAGNLEKAREEFDQSLSLLLESKRDLASDSRLNAEFEKLVENIHGLEVASAERGDQLNGHKYEPAPIESFAGLTFPVDPRIQERVREEIKSVRSDLPLVSNDYVDGVITYLQGRGSGYTTRALKRLGQYQPLFAEVLQKEGLPQDLVYLAAAESAFNPFALSRKGAKGIWQFMLGRGIEYGLKKDRWVDEREDPVKATHAAARHLKDLYQTFGDWYLAMAAYNCGPVNVQKAIEKTGYADFWELRRLHALPVDTENYVPIIVATALIAKDPKAYGFDFQPDPPLETDQVVVRSPTDLRLAAQLIDRPVEELIKLNPGLLRWTTPANNPEFVLKLPRGTRETFEQGIAPIPADKRIWWRATKVTEGETLAEIARRFKLTPVVLARANGLEPDAALVDGSRLVLPMAPGSEASLARVRERGLRRLFTYQVKSRDTLERIADRFDVTPYQIRRWNKLPDSRLTVGGKLKIYASTSTTVSSRRAGTRKARSPRKPASGKTSSASASQIQKKTSPSKITAVGKPRPPSSPRPSELASQVAQ